MVKAKKTTEFAWPLIGNAAAIDFLTKSLLNRRLAQTYIFAGPENLGKNTIAYCFAKNLLLLDENRREDLANMSEKKMSLSGDFHVVEREPGKKNISIEQIRELIKILEMSSFANSYKIGIIKEAEAVSEQGLNALLKTLEEPKSKVVVILITANLEALLPTIVSRSQVINFYPVKTEVIHDYLVDTYKISPVSAKNLSRLALGRPALAIKFLEDQEFYQSYLDRVDLFVQLLGAPLPERFQLVNRWLASRKGEDDLAATVNQLLLIWEGVARDLLLLVSAAPELLQHEVIKEKLLPLAEKRNPFGWMKSLELLKFSRGYLAANVNSKNVLENIAVNI